MLGMQLFSNNAIHVHHTNCVYTLASCVHVHTYIMYNYKKLKQEIKIHVIRQILIYSGLVSWFFYLYNEQKL